jgi:hypothetical protein
MISRNGLPVVGFGEETPDPRELPSSRSAIDLIEGKSGSLLKAGAHTVIRTLLIGSGMYIVGADRGPKLWLRAAGGSLAIEAFAIGWVLAHREKN